MLRQKRAWAEGDTEAASRTEGGIYICFFIVFILVRRERFHIVSVSQGREGFGSGPRVGIQQGIEDTRNRSNQRSATCSSNHVQSSLPSSGSLLRGVPTLAHGMRYYSVQHEPHSQQAEMTRLPRHRDPQFRATCQPTAE